MLYTIRELCEKSKLSRSTLLYYDSIGLLQPVNRNNSNYRIYSDDSLKQLERICMYREAGVPLKDIAKILLSDENFEKDILEKILMNETKKFKKKQQTILAMLNGGDNISELVKEVSQDLIIESLLSLEINDATLNEIHDRLEKNNPKAHEALLAAMGFPKSEIDDIRKAALNSIKNSDK